MSKRRPELIIAALAGAVISFSSVAQTEEIILSSSELDSISAGVTGAIGSVDVLAEGDKTKTWAIGRAIGFDAGIVEIAFAAGFGKGLAAGDGAAVSGNSQGSAVGDTIAQNFSGGFGQSFEALKPFALGYFYDISVGISVNKP